MQLLRLIAFAFLTLVLVACGKKPASTTTSGINSLAAVTPQQMNSNTPVHQERLIPHAAGKPGHAIEPYHPGPAWSTRLQAQFSEVRVKIFPHNSTYTQPEGPEASASTLTFSTSSKCETHAATAATSASRPGAKLKDLLPGTKLVITAEKLEKPFWLVCDQPVRMLRVKEKIEPISYAGKLFVKKVSPAKGAAFLTVVDVLPLEDYVKGVVPSEMPYSWHPEALKVQAVAARTYALYALSANAAAKDEAIQREESGAQLDDTVEYQAFLGVTSEGRNSNQAVLATRGQVLTYQGAIVNAFFHSDSGGHTEDAANVWGISIPYAIGKPEVFPYSMVKDGSWTMTAKLAKLQTTLSAKGELDAAAAPLTGVSVLQEDILASGRAHNVTLESGAGRVKVQGRKFQGALGLHSNLLTIGTKGDAMNVQGRGFGHGVGMSQWGARIMAEHYRKNFEEILKFYYSGVEITALRQ